MKNDKYENQKFKGDENHHRCWWKNGKLHREDGPAFESGDGSNSWWLNGQLHRDDGPAIDDANGSKQWWKKGKRHRIDGPAVEWPNGSKEWFLNGIEYTEKEFQQWLDNKHLNERIQTPPKRKITQKRAKI